MTGYSKHPDARVRARIDAEHRERIMRKIIQARRSKTPGPPRMNGRKAIATGNVPGTKPHDSGSGVES